MGTNGDAYESKDMGDLLGRDQQGLIPGLADKVRPHVGTTLGAHLDTMGDGSLFNLSSALQAIHRTGVGGTLTIEIPRQIDGRFEIDWSPTRNSKL